MKAELKVKFLQHLSHKKQNEGFTLIELLVVMILIGTVSALALPSFLSQAAKAQQSEAKSYVGAIMRAQQAYRLENSSFAADNILLQIGLHTETDNYTYDINNPSNSTTSLVKANSKDAEKLRSYGGGVVIITSSGLNVAVSCQTSDVSNVAPSITLNPTTGAICPPPGEPMK